MSVQEYMKSDTRLTIVNTASELFYKNGYNLTGINEIIEKSGIAKATLYNHFKSKEELLIAYLDSKDEALLENLKIYTSAKPKGNKRILAVLEFILAFSNSQEFNGCWCIRSVAEIPKENIVIRSKIKDSKINFHNFLRTLVQENKSALSASIQKQLSNELYLLYEGAITESHLLDSDWPIKTAIRLFKDKLASV